MPESSGSNEWVRLDKLEEAYVYTSEVMAAVDKRPAIWKGE